jgi:hypothetical protein
MWWSEREARFVRQLPHQASALERLNGAHAAAAARRTASRRPVAVQHRARHRRTPELRGASPPAAPRRTGGCASRPRR